MRLISTYTLCIYLLFNLSAHILHFGFCHVCITFGYVCIMIITYEIKITAKRTRRNLNSMPLLYTYDALWQQWNHKIVLHWQHAKMELNSNGSPLLVFYKSLTMTLKVELPLLQCRKSPYVISPIKWACTYYGLNEIYWFSKRYNFWRLNHKLNVNRPNFSFRLLFLPPRFIALFQLLETPTAFYSDLSVTNCSMVMMIFYSSAKMCAYFNINYSK